MAVNVPYFGAMFRSEKSSVSEVIKVAFSPQLAEMRFGCGLSPAVAPPYDLQVMLDGLTSSDDMAQAFPIEGYESYRAWIARAKEARRDISRSKRDKQYVDAFRNMKQEQNRIGIGWTVNTLLRCTHGVTPFRERLAAFWTDHFTAYGKNGILYTATAPYVEEAIRPHLSGSFADLLIAASTHPLMLHYLDQATSVGPASKEAEKKKRLQGLNENLAREVMELHTLGVGGPYTQEDVRELAELFTGLSTTRDGGFRFVEDYSEPGAETVLGHTYGGNDEGMEPIRAALTDLAEHPATARHIARKLAVHFLSDTPPDDLVAHIEARFIGTRGNLLAVYAALLEHPAAWSEERQNVKPPADFIASAWRALAVSPDRVARLNTGMLRRLLVQPLIAMGQPWQRPNGPDGWPEQDEAWITPPGVSARLRWALAAPRELRPDLPDPREFVDQALGPFATENVRFAASAAESQPEAIGLVLASPAFQRR